MDFEDILQKVAFDNHTTPEVVYREVQAVLQKAYARREEAPEFWAELGFDESCPTPEQFVPKAVQILRRRLETP